MQLLHDHLVGYTCVVVYMHMSCTLILIKNLNDCLNKSLNLTQIKHNNDYKVKYIIRTFFKLPLKVKKEIICMLVYSLLEHLFFKK